MTGPRSGLPRALRVPVMMNGLLALVSGVFVLAMRMLHPRAPHGLPLLFSNPWLTDLLTTTRLMPIIHEPQFYRPEWGWIYPAPCIFIYELLLRPGMWLHHWRAVGSGLYCLFVFAGLATMVGMVVRRWMRAGLDGGSAILLAVTTAVCSWPLWLGIHQGNIEVLLWFGSCLGAYLIFRERWLGAALVIGVVASFKLYPVLLLGMLLARRRYREIAWGLVAFVLVTLAAMQYIGPSIPVVWARLAPGIASFKDLGFYAGHVDRQYLCLDHALIALVRVCTSDNPWLMTLLGKLWIPVFGVLGTALFLMRIRFMPRINQLLFLVLAIVILPPKSYDYTLVMLYLPWAAMVGLAVRDRGERVPLPGLFAAMVLLSLTFSPMLFLRLRGVYFFGQVTAVALLALLAVCCLYRFEEFVAAGGEIVETNLA